MFPQPITFQTPDDQQRSTGAPGLMRNGFAKNWNIIREMGTSMSARMNSPVTNSFEHLRVLFSLLSISMTFGINVRHVQAVMRRDKDRSPLLNPVAHGLAVDRTKDPREKEDAGEESAESDGYGSDASHESMNEIGTFKTECIRDARPKDYNEDEGGCGPGDLLSDALAGHMKWWQTERADSDFLSGRRANGLPFGVHFISGFSIGRSVMWTDSIAVEQLILIEAIVSHLLLMARIRPEIPAKKPGVQKRSGSDHSMLALTLCRFVKSDLLPRIASSDLVTNSAPASGLDIVDLNVDMWSAVMDMCASMVNFCSYEETQHVMSNDLAVLRAARTQKSMAADQPSTSSFARGFSVAHGGGVARTTLVRTVKTRIAFLLHAIEHATKAERRLRAQVGTSEEGGHDTVLPGDSIISSLSNICLRCYIKIARLILVLKGEDLWTDLHIMGASSKRQADNVVRTLMEHAILSIDTTLSAEVAVRMQSKKTAAGRLRVVREYALSRTFRLLTVEEFTNLISYAEEYQSTFKRMLNLVMGALVGMYETWLKNVHTPAHQIRDSGMAIMYTEAAKVTKNDSAWVELRRSISTHNNSQAEWAFSRSAPRCLDEEIRTYLKQYNMIDLPLTFDRRNPEHRWNFLRDNGIRAVPRGEGTSASHPPAETMSRPPMPSALTGTSFARSAMMPGEFDFARMAAQLGFVQPQPQQPQRSMYPQWMQPQPQNMSFHPGHSQSAMVHPAAGRGRSMNPRMYSRSRFRPSQGFVQPAYYEPEYYDQGEYYEEEGEEEEALVEQGYYEEQGGYYDEGEDEEVYEDEEGNTFVYRAEPKPRPPPPPVDRWPGGKRGARGGKRGARGGRGRPCGPARPSSQPPPPPRRMTSAPGRGRRANPRLAQR